MSLFFCFKTNFSTFWKRSYFLDYEKKAYAKVASQVYQKRKIPDSPGGFRFERTKEKNSRII